MKIHKNLKVIQVVISELIASDYNPRSLSDKAEKDLTKSFKKYGLVDPIIVNSNSKRNNIVIGGHQRLKIARKLNYKTVPVVYLDLSLEQEKELNLRLNQNTGEWDFELLKDFEIEMLLDVGFSDKDLSNIWDNNIEIDDDNFDLEKELEDIKNPKSKSGEMYKLGNHYLLCGDSQDLNNVKKLLANNKVDLILQDPPYNIGFSYSNGVSTKGKYQSKMTNDNKTDGDYFKFLKTSLSNSLAVANPNVHVAYWCDENYVGMIQNLYKELEVKHQRVGIWIKNNFSPTPQVAFNKVTEFCVYGTVGKPFLNQKVTNLNEIMNKEVGNGNRLTDDILDLLNIWLVKRLAGHEYEHPTQKPPTLYEKLLRRCTKPGDIILDLFAGSGTTIIAAEQMRRIVFAIEQEPIFMDVIIKRYQELTGKEVQRVN